MLLKADLGIIDWALCLRMRDRCEFSRLLASLESFTAQRGNGRCAIDCIELIDQSSVLHFALHCRPDQLTDLRDVLNSMADANPRLAARRVAHARHAASLRIIRAWRRYAGIQEVTWVRRSALLRGLEPPPVAPDLADLAAIALTVLPGGSRPSPPAATSESAPPAAPPRRRASAPVAAARLRASVDARDTPQNLARPPRAPG